MFPYGSNSHFRVSCSHVYDDVSLICHELLQARCFFMIIFLTFFHNLNTSHADLLHFTASPAFACKLAAPFIKSPSISRVVFLSSKSILHPPDIFYSFSWVFSTSPTSAAGPSPSPYARLHPLPTLVVTKCSRCSIPRTFSSERFLLDITQLRVNTHTTGPLCVSVYGNTSTFHQEMNQHPAILSRSASSSRLLGHHLPGFDPPPSLSRKPAWRLNQPSSSPSVGSE